MNWNTALVPQGPEEDDELVSPLDNVPIIGQGAQAIAAGAIFVAAAMAI